MLFLAARGPEHVADLLTEGATGAPSARVASLVLPSAVLGTGGVDIARRAGRIVLLLLLEPVKLLEHLRGRLWNV